MAHLLHNTLQNYAIRCCILVYQIILFVLRIGLAYCVLTEP